MEEVGRIRPEEQAIQQGAVEKILGGVEEAPNFLDGEDDRQPLGKFGIGDLVQSIGTLEGFDEEEPQGGHVELDRARFQLSILEQIGLVLAEMRLAQSAGCFSEILGETLHGTELVLYSGCSEISALEFLQHHFA